MKISEFAETMKDIRNRLVDGTATTMIEHLVKLIILDSPENINHWRQEIFSGLHEIPKQKKNNKYPTSQFIFDVIWNYYSDDLDKYVDFVIKEEPNEKLKDNIESEDILEPIYSYVLWLAVRLSKYGKVESVDVHNKLKELGL